MALRVADCIAEVLIFESFKTHMYEIAADKKRRISKQQNDFKKI